MTIDIEKQMQARLEPLEMNRNLLLQKISMGGDSARETAAEVRETAAEVPIQIEKKNLRKKQRKKERMKEIWKVNHLDLGKYI